MTVEHVVHDLATSRLPVKGLEEPLSIAPQQYIMVIYCKGCALCVEQPDGMPDYAAALKKWEEDLP